MPRYKAETIKKEMTLEAKEEIHRMRSEAERDVRGKKRGASASRKRD